MRIVLVGLVVLLAGCGREITAPTPEECFAFRTDTVRLENGTPIATIGVCPRR